MAQRGDGRGPSQRQGEGHAIRQKREVRGGKQRVCKWQEVEGEDYEQVGMEKGN